MSSKHTITVTVNGKSYERLVEARVTLADFLRNELDLTGTHLGCEHGVCGACTILLNGEAVRSCSLLAVQADGAELLTVEGLARGAGLHPLQQAWLEHEVVQCGYCQPGQLMAAAALVKEHPQPDDAAIDEAMGGVLCRCGTYERIRAAIKSVAGTAAGIKPKGK